MIVGKNGVGKSRYLSAIVGSLNSCFYDGRVDKIRSYRNQRIKALDGFHLDIISNMKSCNLSVSMGHSEFTSEISDLPRKIIAVSSTQHDKFPIPRKHQSGEGGVDGRYFYLGEKNFRPALTAGPTTILDRVAGSLFRNITDNRGKEGRLSNVFSFLGYRSTITITYRFEISIDRLVSEIEKSSLEEDYVDPKRKYFELKIKNIIEEINRVSSIDEVLDAIDFIKCSVPEFRRQRDVVFDMNFDSGIINSGSIELFRRTYLLRQIGLMRLEDVILSPMDEYSKKFSIREASSGEQCVISTILGVAAEIENNSLICIDEPEISLHPEWQERYIDLLLKTFSTYQGCHFIIATHSPQIVSQMRGENSFILKMETGELASASEHYNKSADYQLAYMLDAPGFSNEFLARECLSLISKIGKKDLDDLDDIYNRVSKLLKVRELVDDADPIASLIDGLEMAVKERT
ncbi:AAA family ATPase [Microbulbifer sp. JTAC008]|uniref:AAA family ATPase n=1 Tax=unclassified Microbulbifer TaxID=2619833 RepID=UPI00403A4B49